MLLIYLCNCGNCRSAVSHGSNAMSNMNVMQELTMAMMNLSLIHNIWHCQTCCHWLTGLADWHIFFLMENMGIVLPHMFFIVKKFLRECLC